MVGFFFSANVNCHAKFRAHFVSKNNRKILASACRCQILSHKSDSVASIVVPQTQQHTTANTTKSLPELYSTYEGCTNSIMAQMPRGHMDACSHSYLYGLVCRRYFEEFLHFAASNTTRFWRETVDTLRAHADSSSTDCLIRK